MRRLGAVILAGLCFLSARAEDWKTTDGKTYQDVKIVKVEDDAVTILYRDGGARVPLALLPVDLQTRFHYDPAKAKIAAAKHDAEEKEADAQFVREVEAQNAQKQRAEQNAIDPRIGLPVLPPIAAPTLSPLPAGASGSNDTQVMHDTLSPAEKDTELGRYKAQVYRMVGSRWYAKLDDKTLQLIDVGMVKIQYTIYYDGSVTTKLLEGGELKLLAAISENAVTQAAPFAPFTYSMRKQVGDSFTDYFTFSVLPEKQDQQGQQTGIPQLD